MALGSCIAVAVSSKMSRLTVDLPTFLYITQKHIAAAGAEKTQPIFLYALPRNIQINLSELVDKHASSSPL
jgi:hypothetical protein